MKRIKYLNNTITYTVSKAKVKNLYISIQDGEVVIKAPWYVTSNQIQEVVESKRKWIYEKLQEYNKSPRKVKEYLDGEHFHVLGRDRVLNISYKNANKASLDLSGGTINVILPLEYADEDNSEQIKKMVARMYQMIAEQEVESALEKWRKITRLAPEEYKIKKLKRAWGNCSSTKKITINSDLMMYSRKAIEYVVLHEICHLKYMNHSKDFWAMVEKYMPEYKEVEKELKR